MNPLKQLLSLLSDGQFHSGTAIGEQLGVSRTAIWKHLQTLASLGLSVESIKGRGYRLQDGFELLDVDVIHSGLTPETQDLLEGIHLSFQTQSTNDDAMSAELPSEKMLAFLTEYQKQGRGRRGRQWISPLGDNIYLSIVMPFSNGIAQMEGLSLAVGVVIAKALTGMGLEGVQLKWPNDILFADRKLGGILVEVKGDPLGEGRLVIGIGLNVRMSSAAEVDQPWITVMEAMESVQAGRVSVGTISRNTIVSELLNGLLLLLDIYPRVGFTHYASDWQVFDAFFGKEVIVLSAGNEELGVANGVADNGALRVLCEAGEKHVYGGEVSLRLNP